MSPRRTDGSQLVHRLVQGRGVYTATDIKRVVSTDALADLHRLPAFRRVLDDIGTGSPLHGLPTFCRVLDDVGAVSSSPTVFRRALGDIGAVSPPQGLPTFRHVLDNIGADSPASTLLDSP